MNTAPLSDSDSQLTLSYYEDLWQELPSAGEAFDPALMAAQHAGYRTLALQAFAAAQAQALTLSSASGMSWRVTHVECLCPNAFPLAKTRRAVPAAHAPDAEPSGPTTVRLTLLARISLACAGTPT